MDASILTGLELAHGSHRRREQGVCAMEAVAWLAGEPHSDHPQCACPVVGAFVRHLNDRLPTAARQRLIAYLPRIVGSRGSLEVEQRRMYIAADFAVRDAAAFAMQVIGETEMADRLRALPEIVDRETALNARAVAVLARGKAREVASARWRSYAAAAAAAADAADADAAAADARLSRLEASFACLDRLLSVPTEPALSEG